jgi:hypothetical protein
MPLLLSTLVQPQTALPLLEMQRRMLAQPKARAKPMKEKEKQMARAMVRTTVPNKDRQVEIFKRSTVF